MSYIVYILECADGSFYTNHTDDLEARLNEINEAINTRCYTYKRLPVKLVYKDQFPSKDEAKKSERRIKAWDRDKKQALIDGDWDKITKLARPKNQKLH
ncbi:GIY-YIG nuclease family protein [uncultured Pseudoteredinibacter sp.]|uniref:GIY-YIG nuclease family protein n=1 Tax=uncultured Pseudoteredinibacter sp. TaxID=1641701 RepID=UPI00260C4FED|nr:GIY-YIG nuclease family protein [uncultured Pseudoteredinibacter sp.]